MDLSTTLASLRKKVAGLSLVALVAGMFATGVATAATAHVFTDVPADAWFAPYVNGLATDGVIDTTKDMYRPGDLVNRAEMAKFAFAVSGLTLETAPSAPFKDVAMGQWYTDYVYTLAKNNIVSGDKKDGVPTGYFRPTDALNRAEATKMLVNAAQLAEDLKGAPHFPDVKSSDWFYNFVETAFNKGIVAGYPDGTFGPAKNINRAEAAKMVYLSMHGVVTGFVLDSAAAASATQVELIFSSNVDKASAETMANYTITDSTGANLAVSAAAVVSGDTVHLTTATQVAGVTYYVVAKNVKSSSGENLANNDKVSFLGYGADVSGGALSVALSTQTPVSGAVPQGATGVVFTCWDMKAGSSAAILKSLRVHRVGPGSQTAFTNVYLYRGDARLTTGRSINSETQMVEFNNVNQTIASGENAKFCLVADLSSTSAGGVHAFEILSAGDVMTNSSDLTGSFPLRGADQLVTSASVGSVTITKNGSLDDVSVGQKGATISQFQLAASGSEDEMLNRVALYIGGSINPSEVTNMSLYAIGETSPLATASAVGTKTLATFTLATPYKIGRGQNKIFYVKADVGGRDGDNIKTYLDTPTDLFVTGVTYGYGVQVKSDTASGGSYDGAGTNYSLVNLKGGVFNIAFNGPTAGDLASGQKQAHCLDMTIANNGDSDVEIRDWPLTLDVLTSNADTRAGLWDATGGVDQANYTLIKLAKLNADGSIAGSLLGPSELTKTTDVNTGTDRSQLVTLSGTATIPAKTTVKAAVVLDVRSANPTMAGDQIQCTLAKGVTNGLAGGSNTIKLVSTNKQLDQNSVTPAAAIVGNIFTIKPSALTVALAGTPSTQTYTRGTANAALAGFAFTAGSSLDETIKSITVTGQIDGDNNGVFSAAGTGTDAGVILSNVIDSGVALYDGSTMVSDLKNINTTTGQIVFNNLNISVTKSSTKNLVLKGNVSNSAPFGLLNKVKFSVQSGNVIAIDQNGQNVDPSSIVTTAADQTAVNSVVMSITAAGTGTVASSSGPLAQVLANGTGILVGQWNFTSVNDNPTLKDLDFAVMNASNASVTNVKLYKGSDCATQIGSLSGYTPTPTGDVQVRDLNEVINSAATLTVCAKVDTGVVNPDGVSQPTSGSNVGLILMSVSKVSSGSGVNVAASYVNTAAFAQTLNTSIDAALTTTTVVLNPAGAVLSAGDVIQLDGEMMLVTAYASPNATVVRGFAGTTPASHIAGTVIAKSTVATRVAAAANVQAGDVYTNAAGTSYCLATSASGVTFTDVFGTTCFGAPVVGGARFPLHGPMSKLYRVVPVLATVALPSSTYTTDATISKFSMTTSGSSNIYFNGGANHIIVSYSATAGSDLTTASCKLNDGTGDIATATPSGATAGTINFSPVGYNFAGTKTFSVNCTGMTVPAAAGSTLSTRLARAADPIQWNDGNVDVNFAGIGNLLLTSDLGPQALSK